MSPEQSMANLEKICQIINHLLAIFTFSSHFTHFGSTRHRLQGTVLQALRLNVEKIIRKGLYQDYNTKNEELKSIKGRIDFQTTLKKQSLISGKVYCHYDEYEENNIYNQMLKAIALRLYKSADINSTHKKKLMRQDILKFFGQMELSTNILKK